MSTVPAENKIPRHVAIIMDGNGRWARKQGKERIFGHIRGVESVREVLKAAISAGVSYLTLYAFSTENWGRPKEETDALMELLCESVVKEIPELKKRGVRLSFIGDIEAMSEKVRVSVEKSMAETAAGDKITLTLAVNYSSRWELTEAARKIARDAVAGRIEVDGVTPQTIGDNLSTAGIPDPDLLIRTSGEVRLSNFLLWQIAYSELYFTDTYWPDFDGKAFDMALEEYARRERRYGKTN